MITGLCQKLEEKEQEVQELKKEFKKLKSCIKCNQK